MSSISLYLSIANLSICITADGLQKIKSPPKSLPPPPPSTHLFSTRSLEESSSSRTGISQEIKGENRESSSQQQQRHQQSKHAHLDYSSSAAAKPKTRSHLLTALVAPTSPPTNTQHPPSTLTWSLHPTLASVNKRLDRKILTLQYF